MTCAITDKVAPCRSKVGIRSKLQRFVVFVSKQTEDWTAAVKADKDIGGDKLASNLGAAQRAIDTFGTKELKEYLDGTCARSLVNAAP